MIVAASELGLELGMDPNQQTIKLLKFWIWQGLIHLSLVEEGIDLVQGGQQPR